ncbi:hypothetical protein LAZ67_5004531, partial [Cordylochernes scorpioides]
MCYMGFPTTDIDENWLSNVLWTDEAHLSLNGEVNTQNICIWASETLGFLQKCHFISPELQFGFCILQDRQALSEIIFMQDGGLPHISRSAEQLLKDTFGEDRVISRHFIYQWPPKSTDLTPCDFWLWGYIKSRVYRCRPTTLTMLKASIRWHVLSISTDMLFNAVQSVIYHLKAVFVNEGRHIEQDYDLIQERRQLPHKDLHMGDRVTVEVLR